MLRGGEVVSKVYISTYIELGRQRATDGPRNRAPGLWRTSAIATVIIISFYCHDYHLISLIDLSLLGQRRADAVYGAKVVVALGVAVAVAGEVGQEAPLVGHGLLEQARAALHLRVKGKEGRREGVSLAFGDQWHGEREASDTLEGKADPATTHLVGEVPEIAVVLDPAVTHGGRPSRAVDSLPLRPEVPSQRDGAGPHDPKQGMGQSVLFLYLCDGTFDKLPIFFVIVLLISLPHIFLLRLQQFIRGAFTLTFDLTTTSP